MRKFAFTFDWQKPIHFPVSRSPYIQCVNLCLTYRFVVLCVHFIVVILAGGVLTGIHPHPLTAVNEDAETEVGNIFDVYSGLSTEDWAEDRNKVDIFSFFVEQL